MVAYTCKKWYPKQVLKTANELRKNKQLCDIVLIIGSEKLHAHRNILVADSDYFKTLFLGPFNESSKAEIDLSPTTSDFPTFEECINYLYTGEIDIDIDNLENVMKMASCFLIQGLQNICSEFVEENLNFNTALKFYFYSVKYGFVELEKKIGAMVKSRFHDYFIFQDETQAILPEQLNHLFENNYLDMCSWDTMLSFLSNWINKGYNNQHLETMKNILEAVETECIDTGNRLDLSEAKGQFFAVKEALEKLTKTIKPNSCPQGKEVVRKCKQLLKSLAGQNASDFLTQGFCKIKSRLQIKDDLMSHTENTVEEVIIAISPKQSVLDAVNELRESSFNTKPWEKFEGTVMDVCAYSPRSREWYHLYSLNDEQPVSSFLRNTSWEPWEYASVGGKIYCATHRDTHKSPAYVLNLEDFSVNSVNEDQPLSHQLKPRHTRLLATTETVYSLSANYTTLSEGAFLRCRKMVWGDFIHFNPGMPGVGPTHVFSLKNPPQDKDDFDIDNHIASLRPDGNEMLIVVGRYRAEGAFVVNLNSQKISAAGYKSYELQIEHKWKSKFRYKCWIQIVAGMDRFYVIEVTKPLHERLFQLSCSYEYMYGSLSLTCKAPTVMYIRDNNLSPPNMLVSPDPPLLHEHVFQHKGSVWIFSGNQRDTSSLFEIFEQRIGTLGVREHTPPPFPYILGAFSAQLSHNILVDKERVVKYLLAN